MAVTRVLDGIVPAPFSAYLHEHATTKTLLSTSGILAANAQVGSLLTGGGIKLTIRSWRDLADTRSNVANDDPTDFIVHEKITSFPMDVRRHGRTKSWSAMDLTNELVGSDPMMAIRSRVAAWWERELQTILNLTLNGIRADNVASNGGDMVVDIAVAANAAVNTPVTAANKASVDSFLDATGTMGDMRDDLVAVVMHSTVALNLEKQNAIKVVTPTMGGPASSVDVGVKNQKFYGKALVIEDDNVTVEETLDPANGNAVVRRRFVTTFFGRGAIAYNENTPNAVETDREPGAGQGSGQEMLYTRKQFVMHPLGFNWTDVGFAGGQLFPTDANLVNPASWNRAASTRKHVPIAFLVSNG